MYSFFALVKISSGMKSFKAVFITRDVSRIISFFENGIGLLYFLMNENTFLEKTHSSI
jgi:hypothetical protein